MNLIFFLTPKQSKDDNKIQVSNNDISKHNQYTFLMVDDVYFNCVDDHRYDVFIVLNRQHDNPYNLQK